MQAMIHIHPVGLNEILNDQVISYEQLLALRQAAAKPGMGRPEIRALIKEIALSRMQRCVIISAITPLSLIESSHTKSSRSILEI